MTYLTNAVKCDIYRASTRDEMYVYVKRNEGETEPTPPSARMPAMMLKALGKPQWVMTLDITPERKLARVNTQLVLEALHSKGFYVQMPPDGLINPQAVTPQGLQGA